MRAIALVPLLIALTPRGPHGPIGDMASSGNGLRTLPRHLPALDAPVFRRDEIQSPWSGRPPRGEILISPNRSTIVGITSTDVPHEFERSPARQLAEITTAFRQLLRESAQFDQLGGRLAGLADNNFTNSSISLEWAPFPLPIQPYFDSGIRAPSIFFGGTKLASSGRLRAYYPALRFLGMTRA